MADAAFLNSLSPPNLVDTSRQGWYVYAYLRSKHGFGRKGTPYYVGIASRANRPFERHSCPIPTNRAYVRVMRSSLSRQEANKWEQRYVTKYGRKDLGTGILLNRTDGGDGSPGHVMPPEAVMRIAAAHRGKINSPETRARMSVAHKGKIISQEQREKLRHANLGKKQSPETIEKKPLLKEDGVCRSLTKSRFHAACRATSSQKKPKASKAKPVFAIMQIELA